MRGMWSATQCAAFNAAAIAPARTEAMAQSLISLVVITVLVARVINTLTHNPMREGRQPMASRTVVQHPVDQHKHICEVEWLGDESDRADRGQVRWLRGAHQGNRNITSFRLLVQPLAELRAVQEGHHHIRQHRVRAHGEGEGEGRASIMRGDDLMTVIR